MTYTYVTCPCCQVALKIRGMEVEEVKPWSWRAIEKGVISFIP